MSEESVTGNIYCDPFYDQGKKRYAYYADCAICGNEIGLSWRGGKRCKTVLKEKGWVLVGRKWVCDKCKPPDAGEVEG